MSAGETLEGLLKIGMTVKDAWAKSKQKNGSLSWDKFLQSPQLKDSLEKSKKLLGQLGKVEIQQALDAVREKQKALLGGKSLMDLPTEKLGQYDALLEVETQLTHKHAVTSNRTAWIGWLVNDALPVLIKVGKVVVPLLV